ncbi:hypothetical protein VTN49DRAFT_6763 [Thermomyces lanuginosus]|uniref:uncharacterized protein n=1 Tax=Thermomyces lanuginosus TaxID=5541 RepID=UPI0037429597
MEKNTDTEMKDASAPHTPNPNAAAAAPAIPPVRPVPAPRNRVLQEVQSQWYFTDEELMRTPSQLDGMSMEAEFTGRSKGVNFITQVGIMLKLPQLTLATAAVYLHRFFVRHSMVDKPQRPGLHPYPIAATALFLASKMEENSRKMREFVVACCRVAQKKPDLVVDEQSKEFWKWRDTILHHEDLLLEALCFDLQLEQPYRILYEFLCFFGVADHKPLRNAAWAFVNDSCFTVLCLQFEPRVIAAAALYAAARLCDVAFPDDAAGRPWWVQIDVDLFQVRRACNRMVRLYETNATPVHRQSHPYPVVLPVDDHNETTRLDHGKSSPAAAVNGRKRSLEPEQQQPSPSSGDLQSPSKRARTTTSPDDQTAATNGHDPTSSSTSAAAAPPPPPPSSSAPTTSPPPPPRPSSRVPAAYRPPARPPAPQNQPPSSSSTQPAEQQRPPGSSADGAQPESSNPEPNPAPSSSRDDIEEGEVDG